MAAINKGARKAVLGGKTASVDIPKPRNGDGVVGRDHFTVAPAKPVPGEHPDPMLPTPPNSISPSLPPQNFVGRGHVGTGGNRPPTPHALDSEDPDMRGVVDPGHDDGQARTRARDSGPVAIQPDLDATGAITPALLAKYHLPDILLAHGPLAIRHLMNYLTISVPGFSRIPPARARRIVVSALEGRGSGGGDDAAESRTVAGGGLHGDVMFEKVGWGRWDARLRGQPPRRERRDGFGPGTPGQQHNHEYSPPASVLSSTSFSHSALPLRGNHYLAGYPNRGLAGTSWTEESVEFSHHDDDYDEGGNMDDSAEEHEADRMSLDHEHDHSMASSSSEADPANEEQPDGYPNDNNEEREEDITDDEDWAGIGAAALRQASYTAASSSNPRYRGGGGNFNYRVRRPLKRPSPSPPASAHRNHSATNRPPARRFKSSSRTTYHPPRPNPNIRFSPPPQGLASNSQEREAIEALVQLSHV